MAVPQKVRTFALPAAMILGAVFNGFFDRVAFLTPYFIFTILLLTYCRIPLSRMKVQKLHWILLALQLLGGTAIYLVLSRFDGLVAQGLMMCAFAPVAMAAVVVAGMLGANITTMATFTLMSNIGVAIAAPVLFTAIGVHPEISFVRSVLIILARVGPLLILPFLAAWLIEKLLPGLHTVLGRSGDATFLLWALSLMIVVGRTVKFIISQPKNNYTTEVILAAGSLVICVAQFALGRYFGRKAGDVVAGGQSLGQKNTILAIWMSQTFLDPLASVAPAAYVIWQNIVNSWQIWKHDRKPGNTITPPDVEKK